MVILTNKGFQLNILPKGRFLIDLNHTPLFPFVCYRKENPTSKNVGHCDGLNHLEMGITSAYIKELI
jgi:hypothetical protein